MSTITLEQAQDIVSAADLEYEDIYPEYSGRAMYGRTCVGFVVPNTGMLLNLGLAIGTVLDEYEAQAFMGGARTDNLGLDMIVYFPEVQIAEDGDVDDE